MLIREATTGQHAGILGVLDGAALQTDSEQIQRAIQRGDVYVAVPERNGEQSATAQQLAGDETPPIVGVCVHVDDKITAIAVRPGRRGQGIGTRLVDTVKQSQDRIVIECEPDVCRFWEFLGFEMAAQPGSSRFSGVWTGE